MREISKRRLPGARDAPVRPRDDQRPALIGPNTLLQTRRALEERHGGPGIDWYRRTGIPRGPFRGMVEERHFVGLVAELRRSFGEGEAGAILARAGRHTATYVRRNRIPAPLRAVLPYLPTGPGLRVLLAGIRRHAWTFVGSGTFDAEAGRAPEIRIGGCPTCRGERLGAPGGTYYVAAFEELLRELLRSPVRVRERTCTALGAPVCSFAIETDSRRGAVGPADSAPSKRETPCVS